MATHKKPTHGVYIVEGEGDRAFWMKIGAAWPTGNGDGFTIQLSALPLNGRLVIQKLKAKRDDE